MERDLQFERFLKHPPERVWKALTDPRYLASWYMDNDFEPVVGHRFQFHTDPGPGFDGVIYCEVIAVDEPHRLAYRFRAGANMQDTIVTWTLTPQADGTLLRLDHTGFRGLQNIITSFILQYGWWGFLRGLPATLAAIQEVETDPISD